MMLTNGRCLPSTTVLFLDPLFSLSLPLFSFLGLWKPRLVSISPSQSSGDPISNVCLQWFIRSFGLKRVAKTCRAISCTCSPSLALPLPLVLERLGTRLDFFRICMEYVSIMLTYFLKEMHGQNDAIFRSKYAQDLYNHAHEVRAISLLIREGTNSAIL